MVRKTLDAHIEITPGIVGGKPRIAGHRIKVQHVAIWHEHLGMTPQAIAKDYGLTRSEVHAALAYYYDHREEIDKDILDDEAFVEEIRKKTPSKLAQRLKEKKSDG